jgi:hypothetical protein
MKLHSLVRVLTCVRCPRPSCSDQIGCCQLATRILATFVSPDQYEILALLPVDDDEESGVGGGGGTRHGGGDVGLGGRRQVEPVVTTLPPVPVLVPTPTLTATPPLTPPPPGTPPSNPSSPPYAFSARLSSSSVALPPPPLAEPLPPLEV